MRPVLTLTLIPPPSRAQSPVERIAKTSAQRMAEFRARKKRKQIEMEEEERKVQKVQCKSAPWPFVSTSSVEILFAHPHIIRPLQSKSNFIMSCARRLISTILVETSSRCCESEKLSSQKKGRRRSARCRQTRQNCRRGKVQLGAAVWANLDHGVGLNCVPVSPMACLDREEGLGKQGMGGSKSTHQIGD